MQLGFKPSYDIDKIVWDLIQNRARFADFDNPAYHNITTFRTLTAEGHLGVTRIKAPMPTSTETPTPVEV